MFCSLFKKRVERAYIKGFEKGIEVGYDIASKVDKRTMDKVRQQAIDEVLEKKRKE